MAASLSVMVGEVEIDEWVTRTRAAELLGLTVKRVDQLRVSGVLPSVRNPVTGRVKVHRASVEYQRRLRAEP